MPGSHLFLSDVHLEGFDPETNHSLRTDLISLTDYCGENSVRLHILGDLFDYWMEYPGWKENPGRHPDPGAGIPTAFSRLAEKTGPVTYITGNHDNWTRGYFETIGLDVEPEYRRIELGGHSLFLHHGDGLTDPSLGLPRPPMHRVLRNSSFLFLYQNILPPSRGLWLMKRFSRYKRSRSTSDPSRLNEWAREFLQINRIDFVICGHDHIPRIETYPYGTYINSGAFYLHRTMVYYTKGKFQLVTWNRNSRKLLPFRTTSPVLRQQTITG